MKQSYKIPTSLDMSYLDTEVALQTNGGIGFRPMPLRVILVWIVAIFGSFLLCLSEHLPFHYMSILGKGAFIISVIGFVFLVTASDQGGQSRFKAIRNMCKYMFNKKTERIIRTRSTDDPTTFYRLIGVKEINEKNGMISFLDGTYGYCYRIVGNASALLFDADRSAIIDRVDNFYRKVPDFIRLEYVTVKEPQKTVSQRANLKRMFRNRDNTDKDILKVMQDSYETLDKFVGGEFKSIHQYLFLVAGSKEYANKAHTILANECSNSGLMFNTVEPLYQEDIEILYHTIYAGD